MAQRMGMSWSTFRWLSVRGYVCWFGTLFALTTYGPTLPPAHQAAPTIGLLVFNGLIAGAGIVFLCWKNRGITFPVMRSRIMLADLLLSVVLLAIVVVPVATGLKQVLLIAVITAYIVRYVDWLYKGKLVALDA